MTIGMAALRRLGGFVFATRLLSGIGLCAGLAGLATCGGQGSTGPGTSGSSDPIAHMYSSATTTLQVEVDYQTGAEPYTGTLINMDTWNLFKVNAGGLFNNAKTLKVPTTLAEMEALGDISGTSFTTSQILDIAARHRGIADSSNTSTFYVLFLNGNFKDGSKVRTDVLGISIGTTTVIAMFKPVIVSSSNLPNIRKFVEQSTLIHEFGHAVGLVNNGVPMTTPHQDTANGAHDSSSKCVMYYANEGASAAAQYAQQYIVTGNEILFDANCLADTSARMAAGK